LGFSRCLAGFGAKERALGEAALIQVRSRSVLCKNFDVLLQIGRNVKNTITGVKRLLGRKWSEPAFQEEIKDLPYNVVQLENDEVGVKVTLPQCNLFCDIKKKFQVLYCGEQRVFSVISVAAMILGKLKSLTERKTGMECKDVVISVSTIMLFFFFLNVLSPLLKDSNLLE